MILLMLKMRVTSKEINGGCNNKEKFWIRLKEQVKLQIYHIILYLKNQTIFKNAMDITIQLKDGRILGFSIVSKSSKDLSRFSCTSKKQTINECFKIWN